MANPSALQLIPATPDMLRAELRGCAELAQYLGIRVPASWPPELYERTVIADVLAQMLEQPDRPEWWLHYFAVRDEEQGDRVLVGNGGFKGPPQSDGNVEIGYSILPEFRRQGYAAEATVQLVAKAFAHPEVTRVVAETLPEMLPAIGVLGKAGFKFAGEGSDEGLVRYELSRTNHERTRQLDG
jgi:[ribosomal protein S5]-alanine N-acetyltransferase